MVKLLKLSIFWLNATTATHIETDSIQSIRKTIEGIYNTRKHFHYIITILNIVAEPF